MNEEKKKEGGKVLLVDDDELLLDMYATKFKERGFTVETAQDGKSTIQKFTEGYTPDIILIDVVMPGVDGFELLAAIRKEEGAKDATAIMLSNQGQEADVERARQLGADCYILKASATPSEVVTRAIECREKHS